MCCVSRPRFAVPALPVSCAVKRGDVEQGSGRCRGHCGREAREGREDLGTRTHTHSLDALSRLCLKQKQNWFDVGVFFLLPTWATMAYAASYKEKEKKDARF